MYDKIKVNSLFHKLDKSLSHLPLCKAYIRNVNMHAKMFSTSIKQTAASRTDCDQLYHDRLIQPAWTASNTSELKLY